MFGWVGRKDLLYWLIIIIMASILSSDIGKDSIMVDKWEFAGTVVSIILAVIAILYTFDQSSTTVASAKKLEESANRVEESTKGLEDKKLNEMIKNLEKRLSKLLKDMKGGIEETNKKIDSLGLKKSDYSLDKETAILDKEEWEKYLDNVIVKKYEPVGLTLLYSYFLYENKLKYIDRDTKNWLWNFIVKNDVDKEAAFNMAWGTIVGQMRLFASLNVFTYDVSGIIDDTEDGDFTYYNDDVYQIIKNIVENKGNDNIKSILEGLETAFKKNLKNIW